MRRVIYWLRRKKRLEKRDCGSCCITCKYYEKCRSDATIICSIYDKYTMEFIGYCQIKDMRTKVWEIAIEELEKFRNKGYGYSTLRLFLSEVYKRKGQKEYKALVDIDNVASQRLFAKIGYPDGLREFMLQGEELELFRRDNMHLIDDQIRNTAKEFCVDSEDLIGYVLQYRIMMH